MCTVTFLPTSNTNFIFTSNRDETPLRKTLPPKVYHENGVAIRYPKDELAGGTWIGTSEKNRIVCVLNGGYQSHERQPPYKLSRGVIVKNVLSAIDVLAYIKSFDFTNIEPFTLLVLEWNTINLNFMQFVWTGKNLDIKELPNKPQIWSSSNLYNPKMKKERENWFNEWLEKTHELTQEKVLAFHSNENLGTKATSIKMKRPFIETVSLTSIQKGQDKVTMDYVDFLKTKKS